MQRTAAAAGGVVAAPYFVPASALGADGNVAPSNRITMGFIGTGNQGTGDMKRFLRDKRVQVLAVADPNLKSAGYWNGAVGGREPAQNIVNAKYASQRSSGTYKGCDAYEDFREIISRKDIDAVEVATPDHWHAIPVIMAAKAGKDIYCQKPLALTIQQGRAMSDAVRSNKRILQTGSQQRSDRNFRRACELVRNGRIGKLETVKVGLPGGTPDISHNGDRTDPEPVPEGFNYNFWLGPAPDAAYCPARCHVNFRWILDYSGGQVTDWGGHHPDIAQWGMNTEDTGPIEIKNPEAEWADHPIYNTATKYSFECVYANGVTMTVSSSVRSGVKFEGTEGWVWANRGRHDASSKAILESEIGENEIHLYKSKDHYRNFIDCVISREQPIAPVETAHRSITIAHLGNIAMRLGRGFRWDPKKERVIGDPEADKMTSRPMRSPWHL